MDDLHAQYRTAVMTMSWDDLPSRDMRTIARACGMPAAITLLQNMPGIDIYVPANNRKRSVRSVADLPDGDLRLVAGRCSFFVAKSLFDNLGGAVYYIPKQGQYGPVLQRFIIGSYDGSNAKILALVTGISIREAYQIIASENEKRAQKQAEKLSAIQCSLFQQS